MCLIKYVLVFIKLEIFENNLRDFFKLQYVFGFVYYLIKCCFNNEVYQGWGLYLVYKLFFMRQ